MGQIDEALGRLESAMARLETAITEARGTGESPAAAEDAAGDIAALTAERDRLAGEVRGLRERAAEETRLRADAARAVREALHDLRGAVGHSEGVRHDA